MRAISLVNRIEFEFKGNVVRNALTIGDVDNDGCNELVVGNQNGDVTIFKGREKFQEISKLSFISCVAVGDILNNNRNSLVVVTADGWCYIYESPPRKEDSGNEESIDHVDGQTQSGESFETPASSDSTIKSGRKKKNKNNDSHLLLIHVQRIPANVKNILLGDVDGDGMIEMVLGLTDRVVRSYRWIPYQNKSNSSVLSESLMSPDCCEKPLGKLVALNKWECANQIGSITLHHSWDNKPSLLIAQPGGTFMRIRCQLDDAISQALDNDDISNSSSNQSEQIPGSVDYQSLGISRMRNQNISTEILGDFKSSLMDASISYDRASIKSGGTQASGNSNKSGKVSTKGRPYAVATLDGTIMLVQDEVILWAIAVDHQVFALTKLDVTGNGFDDIVVCSWDGQTYILDQEKNSIRFQLDEPVQAFDSGYYNLGPNEPPVTCLVYVTFKNTIIIYYDIPLKELTCKKFEPDVEKLSELFRTDGKTLEESMEVVKNLDKKSKKELLQYLLYNIKT